MVSGKRGRPILETDDPRVQQRRQRTAERTRRYYNRQRVAASQNRAATSEQLQQGEGIVTFTEEDTPATLASIGLRVQGIALAQDLVDAHERQDSAPVDEHNELYSSHLGDLDTIDPPQQSQPSAPSPNRVNIHRDRNSITRFFQTRPPTNPLSPTPISLTRYSTPVPASIIEAPTSTTITDFPRSVRDIQEADGPSPFGEDDEHDIRAAIQINSELNNLVQSDEQSSFHSLTEEGSFHGFDEESSFRGFSSEHSATDDEGDSGPGIISAEAFSVQKLYDQLQGGFHGCSDEQHEDHLNEHISAVGDNHYGLDEIFNDADFPSVLALSDLISPDRLARQVNPNPEQWQEIFCGISPSQQRPINVCLHRERAEIVQPQVAFDIDSFLGFTSSLAVARQGLWYQPAPQMRQNMTTDVHLEANIFQDGEDPNQPPRSSLAMLRDVPHFLLGRVVGAHDITLYILFPHLASSGDRFTSLTQNQLTRWLDQIFHPAVYRYYEAHYNQHLPASYRQALANSKAHQVEGRLIETASYQAQQALGYHLQPEYLGPIWDDILRTIEETAGLGDFRDPQLFFSAKGTKLQFKTSPSRPTMLDAMENFAAYFERIMDLDFIFLDRFYVDIGKEICPRVSLLPTQHGQEGEEAQVYLWRRCCLERYIHWMYNGQPPARGSQGRRFYEVNMLYDAASLTSVSPKQSRLRQGGLIYSQFYSSVKEVWDAAKYMPFNNDGLEELALDPQIRQGAREAAGGHRRSAKIIERAYCASKRRTRHALCDSQRKSFGIREEHRISWRLFQALAARLRLESEDELEIVLPDRPSYVWGVKTDIFLHYLYRSADKFATGFEVVRARCRQDLVTWEQTKVMAMFLRCLRFVLGGHQLSRESALWWSRRERSVGQPPETRVWFGLGFSNTLSRYGYCWIEPRIDWDRMVFRSDITDRVLFGNNILRGQYLRRGGQVRDFFDLTRRLELALEWLDRHHEEVIIRDRLIYWMVHICLHQFRVDTLANIRGEIQSDHREEALEGDRPFCKEYLEEILEEPLHLVSGNRSDFKEVSHLGHFLFDFSDGRERVHWEDRPFRKLYRRACTALSLRHDGQSLRQAFSRRLGRSLFAYHWILPYPCTEVFTQTTKQGRRMWYSIQVRARPSSQLDMVKPEQWEWARKSWQTGFPPDLPQYTKFTKEEWQDWIDRHRSGPS